MDNRRLILMVVFFFSLFLIWEAWQKQNRPPVAATTTIATAATTTPAPAVDPSIPIPVPASQPPPAVASLQPSVAAATQGEIVSVKTDLFVADISTQGGDVVGLSLNNYKDNETKGKNLSLFEATHQYSAQSGLIGEGLPTHKSIFRVAPGPRELSSDGKTISLRLEAPEANGVQVSKILTFTRGSYVIDVRYEINNATTREVTAHAYYQLLRDMVAPAGESRMVSTYTGPALYTEQEKYQKVSFKDIEKDDKLKFNPAADNGWVAMIQHYFVSAWIPPENIQRDYYIRKLEGTSGPLAAVGMRITLPTTPPNTKSSFSTTLYAGPQTNAILKALAEPSSNGGIGAAGLPLVVDHGWLTIIAAPIFWSLEAIHKIVGNWGWSIVLLTLCIKAIFFPLSAASYKSMAKMKAIAPRMAALRERCGDDKQKLNTEMMTLYKTEKINPLGGCLPIVIQIPVFIALYWALLGAVEMRGAPWILWIDDLSAQDPFYILPVIMMATMFIQTKLNPTPPDPVQAKITMFMPFVFGGMFFFFPAGLVLYWVVNNTLSIAQQWQISRMVGNAGKAANDAKV